MKKTFLLSVLLVVMSVFMIVSCGKALDPDQTGYVRGQLRYSVSCAAEIVSGLTRDSVRVSFVPELASWDTDSSGASYIVLLYKWRGSSSPELVYGQYVGNADGDTVVSYVNQDFGLALSAVKVSSDSVVTFLTDSGYVDSMRYSARVVFNVKKGSSGKYGEGFLGQESFTNFVISGAGLGASIAGGRIETSVNPVGYQIVVPFGLVKTIVVHKYSAMRPIASVDSIVRWSKMRNDTGSHFIGKILNGYYAKPETISIDNPRPSMRMERVGGSGFRISDTISLAMNYGRKYLCFECLNSSGVRVGDVLWDDISIGIPKASIAFDNEMANRDSFLVDDIEKRLCVFSGSFPFVFDTYGDTSFDSEVQLWVATRKVSSRFFTSSGLFGGTSDAKSGEGNGMIYKSNGSVVWGDCIFETSPENFEITSSGRVRGRLLEDFDYKTGYRVSPLASISTQNLAALKSSSFSIPQALNMGGIERSDSIQSLISRFIKPGSILGHDLASLNTFKASTIFHLSGNDTSALAVPAWFEAVSFSELNTGSYQRVLDFVKQKFPGYSEDLDKHYNSLVQQYSLDDNLNLYEHPFRGIPVTAPLVGDGAKEFIVIALAKGRFFGETRVYFSKSSSKYSFVWDAIPPQFRWPVVAEDEASPIYSPTQSLSYAPMCYKDPVNASSSRCTDFSQFTSNLFDVYFSTFSGLSRACAVRDAGFGKIKAVKLLFNYSADYIGSDPITGERKYTTPSQVKVLPKEILDRQGKKDFYSGKQLLGSSYALTNVVFKNIDFSGWRPGMWDMWVETEDNLGNRGLAPYASSYVESNGEVSVRKIEIK